MQEKSSKRTISRRTVLKGSIAAAGTVAAASALLPPTIGLANVEKQIEDLEKEGWEKRPVACTMCGAFCGLLLMQKKGEPASESTVRIFPNPGHPQQGYCGRSTAAMWVWNHPLRLKKPMKRVGERGEGRFEEISWDQALDEIGEKVRRIVNEHGERSIAATSHTFSGYSKWLTFPLGSVNNIGHQSSCNAAGIAGRDWVFGKSFNGAGKLEPDYANLRYLILIGRSMGASMGALHTLNAARDRGAKVVAIDPRMPDLAYGDAKWVGIRPGTDNAFVLSLIHILLRDRHADLDFTARHTNGAYLLTEDGLPLTESRLKKDGRKDFFAVFDGKSGKIVFQGVKKENGANVEFIEDPSAAPALEYFGEVKLSDGTTAKVGTCFSRLKNLASRYAPAEAEKITGIPAKTIEEIARDFALFKGVIDDGWYTSKNGTDVELYQLIGVANALIGNIDRKGGLIVTAGAGLKIPSVSHGKGPNGEKWEVSKDKRIDRIVYPEAAGTFRVALEAAVTGKPYPIKGAFIIGSTMFHREANSEQLAKGLKALDLLVVQDVMPHEIVDYADYVLPATYFLERKEMSGVKWARDGSIYLSDPGLTPPEGVDARHDVWIALEIVRRAFPERAERVGYKECRTVEEFNKYFDGFTDKGFNAFLKAKDAALPGEGARIKADIESKGWSLITPKKYDVYPYRKPFATPSGKVEIYSFKSFSAPGYHVQNPLPGFVASPAYTAPDPAKGEFYLVSGKNCNSCSGLNMFTYPTKFIGDRTLWMHPEDAGRMGIENGETVAVLGIDTSGKGESKVTVTKKVVPGTVFAFGFSGGVRTANLASDPEYDFVKEGINSHWYASGYAQPLVGNVANNSAVRIQKIRG